MNTKRSTHGLGASANVAYSPPSPFRFVFSCHRTAVSLRCALGALFQASKVASEAKCREQAQLNQLTVEHAKDNEGGRGEQAEARLQSIQQYIYPAVDLD